LTSRSSETLPKRSWRKRSTIRSVAAEVAFQQVLFQPIERLFAQRLLDEGGNDRLGHLLAGPGQSRAQALEPALLGRVGHATALAVAGRQVTVYRGARQT
jgi:hypothetical protein